MPLFASRRYPRRPRARAIASEPSEGTEMAAAASASTGPMNVLLGKLSSLLCDEYKLLKGVRKDIEFLHRELGSMNALLQRLAEEEEGLDAQRKEWRGRVRELAYDVEDCIDAFTHHLGRRGDDDVIQKALLKVKKLKARHQIASQIQELKSHVVEESERCRRYHIEAAAAPSSRLVKVDPRLAALYVEANRLVGIDGPREELTELLMVKRDDGGDK